MPLFFMPNKMVSSLEKIQRELLWKGRGERKDHLVKWDLVCKSNEVGGLGTRGFKEKNMAL